MATTRKERAAETEAALKEAAKRVFTRSGYLATKITDITREAGRAAGSFYNHFPSKEALLAALLADMLRASDVTIADDPGHSADFTDLAAIRWHVAGFWHFYRANLPVMVAIREAAVVDAEFSARLDELLAVDEQYLVGHLATVRNLPGQPRFVVAAMTGLLSECAYRWFVADPAAAPTDDEAIELLTTMLHSGIAGRG